MPKADKQEMVRRTVGALQPWEEELAREARDEKSKETLGVPRITHRGGYIEVDGQKVADNKIKLLVVDYVRGKEFYEGAFDPDVPATPGCYAFAASADGEAGMRAHEQAPHPQNLQADPSDPEKKRQYSPCAGCRHNAFNTAENGRGKRCKDVRRLLVVAPIIGADGKPKFDPEAIQKSEVRQVSIPPGSLANWGNYLTSLRDMTRTGNVREMAVELGIASGKKRGYVLTFTPIAAVPAEGVRALLARRRASEGLLTQPFPVLEAVEEAEKPDPKRAKKLRSKID